MIYTIGHSNVELERFIDLLQFYHVELVVDVRSMPVSKYAVWFNKRDLERAIGSQGMGYKFMGQKLGGKPDDPEVLGTDGEPDYDLLKNAEYFKDGMEELVRFATERTVAVMCSEENPSNCHRSLLITPTLEAAGLEVAHIRHDGKLVKNIDLRPQMSLPF